MVLRSIVATTVLFSICTVAAADSVDINLNNDSARFAYGMDYGAAQVSLGGMYKKQNDNDSDWVGHLGLEVVGEEGVGRSSTLEGGLGARVYAASVSDYDALALALGGHVELFPRRTRFGLGVYGYYAPEVVAGLDIDRFWEVGARLEFRMLENAGVYLGYRLMKARIEDTARTITVDDAGHVGIMLRF